MALDVGILNPKRVDGVMTAALFVAGGNWDVELDADESVTVDGDLVTAHGPWSSAAAA